LIAFGPTTQEHNRTVGFTCKEHLLERDQGAGRSIR
jgi:hypothetical protein